MLLSFEDFKTRKELTAYLLETNRIKDASEAAQWITDHVPLEKVFQTKIMKWLQEQKMNGTLPRLFLHKQQAGMYQRQGLPDITAIIDGQYFGFEVKRPFVGKLSAIQKETIDEINAAGGHAFEVSYISDVESILIEAGMFSGKRKPEPPKPAEVKPKEKKPPEVHKDCPGYMPGGCRILSERICDKKECGFYPPTAAERTAQAQNKKTAAATTEEKKAPRRKKK